MNECIEEFARIIVLLGVVVVVLCGGVAVWWVL
jgi:hypothetical protein